MVRRELKPIPVQKKIISLYPDEIDEPFQLGKIVDTSGYRTRRKRLGIDVERG
jgi:hypothetical protein